DAYTFSMDMKSTFDIQAMNNTLLMNILYIVKTRKGCQIEVVEGTPEKVGPKQAEDGKARSLTNVRLELSLPRPEHKHKVMCSFWICMQNVLQVMLTSVKREVA
ncbi:LOW QUALITY PROTEIN: hypothetical protein J0S82_020380, partial [Galemys pyrenaicus]